MSNNVTLYNFFMKCKFICILRFRKLRVYSDSKYKMYMFLNRFKWMAKHKVYMFLNGCMYYLVFIFFILKDYLGISYTGTE